MYVRLDFMGTLHECQECVYCSSLQNNNPITFLLPNDLYAQHTLAFSSLPPIHFPFSLLFHSLTPSPFFLPYSLLHS